MNTAYISLALLMLAGTAAQANAVYVKPHVGGTHDGTSWATAFDKVQEAVNAAASGDEVWVAQGTYVENVALRSGVALYGGFAGTETQRTQRDWRTRVTTLDGDRRGPVVDVARDATTSTRIDGFTIRNGLAVLGGGVYVNQRANAYIVNNTIAGNEALNEGGGIYCNIDSAPTIAVNMILRNSAVAAGGGISSSTGNTDIADNIIASNSAQWGGGICLGDPTATSHEDVSNNTVVSNSATKGGGVYCRASSASSISNNIIAFNASGIFKESGGSATTLRANCVYGNDYGNYSGISAGATDISSDPRLASSRYGKGHIQPDSPCKEHGNNSYVAGGFTDIDGQTRIVGTVDIGADESDGTTWPVTSRTVRVTPSGNDSNDGSAWDSGHARLTVQSAIDNAAQTGGEVWVRYGTYNERVALRDYVYVYGGFAGSETNVLQRNWRTNTSTIDAQQGGSAVTGLLIGHRTSAIDGFTLRNGRALYGAGVRCDGASPLICNNTITACTATGKGGGVYLGTSSALVKNNVISTNVTLFLAGGICADRSSADISANSIDSNSAAMNGCGVYVSADSLARIINNRIVRNTEDAAVPGAWGGGISIGSYCSPSFANNTLSDNSANGLGAFYCSPYGTVIFSNSVVAFNSSGIYVDDASTVTGVKKNCVYSNSSFNYRGFSGGTGDIVQNPLFVNRTASDYHITAGSPCVETADTTTAPSEDLDGNARPLDGNANLVSLPDIGCYEYARPFSTVQQAKSMADGALVAITGMVSTAVLSGRFYMETPDRVTGIGVIGNCSAAGKWVTVEGTMTTSNGERVIAAYNVVEGADAKLPLPWFINYSVLGGGGFGLQEGVWDYRKVRKGGDWVRDLYFHGGA